MSDAYFTLQVYRIYEKHLKDLGIDLDKIMDAKTINPLFKEVEDELRRLQNKEGCYKAGQFLADMKEQGQIQPGQPKKEYGHDVPILRLKDIGIEPQESKRWQRIAAIPEEKFEEVINSAKKKTQSAFLEKTYVNQATGEDEWYTPQDYIELNEPVLEERMETFYANAFTIGIADGNVLMVFELHVQGREVAEKVIVMSPNGFKTLIKSAEKEIEAFEKEQGRVEEWNLPPEEKGLLAI